MFENIYTVAWNSLPKDVRYLGFKKEYYDGPIYCFGLWYWHIYVQQGGFSWVMFSENKLLKNTLIELTKFDKRNKAFLLTHPEETIRKLGEDKYDLL